MSSGRLVLLSVLLGLIVTPPLPAQNPTGTIGGRVVDGTGAVIPGAEASVRNMETGLTRNGITNEEGLFRFPALPVGRYEITVNMQGFKKSVVSNLELNVDARVEQTMVLEIGQVSDLVTVEANTVAVNTVTPDLGAVVNEQMVRELPLNGRNFVQLAGIHAGVTPDTHSRSTAGGINRRSGIAVAISGSRPSSTAFIFDGIPFKEHFYGAPGSLQPIDSIQEFKVQKGFFTGRYDSAGVINLVTKSGTNRVRATVMGLPSQRQLRRAPILRYRRIAGVPPEPVRLRGRRTRDQKQAVLVHLLRGSSLLPNRPELCRRPHAGLRAGDLSSFTTPVIDPLTGEAFPGNRIPATRFAAFSQNFMDEGFIRSRP